MINFLQQSPDWNSTAVIIAYDDSDGWYDHQTPPIVNPSTDRRCALTGNGQCGSGARARRRQRGTRMPRDAAATARVCRWW